MVVSVGGVGQPQEVLKVCYELEERSFRIDRGYQGSGGGGSERVGDGGWWVCRPL